MGKLTLSSPEPGKETSAMSSEAERIKNQVPAKGLAAREKQLQDNIDRLKKAKAADDAKGKTVSPAKAAKEPEYKPNTIGRVQTMECTRDNPEGLSEEERKKKILEELRNPKNRSPADLLNGGKPPKEPGKQYFEAIDPAEERRRAQESKRTANNLGMALGGPFVAMPMAAARAAGMSEDQVGEAGMLGVAALDVAGARMGTGRIRRKQTSTSPQKGSNPPGATVEKPPLKPTPPKTKTTAGEPIDVVTGEVIYEEEDFLLPGDLPIRLFRVHLSGTPVKSCFGPKWFNTWGQHVTVTGNDVTYHAEDGYPYTFDRPERGESSIHVTQRKVRLTALDDGWQIDNELHHTLTFTVLFEGQYRLTSIADRNGNRIDFHYLDGALRQVLHSGGYRLKVEGSPYAITRILLEGEQHAEPVELIRYGYNHEGNLTGIFNATDKPLTFRYDTGDRMTRWQDRNGNWYGYTYDHAGRCIEGIGIEHVFANRFEYDDVNRRTTFVDSFGARTVYHYNEQQLVTRIDLPDGSSTHTEWDELGNKASQVDGNGAVTEFEHDPFGNLITVTNPLGQRTSIRYNKRHQPVLLTDTAGLQWQRKYDGRGNLVASGVKDGPTYRYARNEQGRLIKITDPAGHSATFGYDRAGLLLWSSASAPPGQTGPVTRLERDAQGRVVRRTDALGRSTQYHYHALGKLAQVVQADGSTLAWDYDPENNLLRHEDANHEIWRYAYGAFDKLATVQAPNGAKTRYEYDAELRLARVINPLGLQHDYRYTATGLVASEKDFDGRTTVFEYDAAAHLIRHIAPQGEVIEYQRNALGQLVRKLSPDLLALFDYNAYGQLGNALTYARTEQDDPARDELVQLWQRRPQSVITFERDVFGRVIQESQNGRTVQSSYNERGQRTSRITDCGQQSLWDYDPNGLPAELKLAGDEQFHFLRDAVGRETKRRIFGRQDLERAKTGHQRFAGAGEGFVMTAEYDAQDRLVRQWAGDAETLAEREIEYDPMGQATRLRDARWGEDQFRYDKAGQIAQRSTQLPIRQQGQQPGVAHELYGYDLAGNVIAAIKKNSRTGAGYDKQNNDDNEQRFAYRKLQLEQAGETRYRYDAAGRLIERIDGKRWNRTGIADGRQVWHYQWNSDNRLTAVITPEGDRWQYSYDALGRRLTKQGPDTDIQYLWDQYTIAEEVTRKKNSTTGAWEESIAVWDYEPGSFRPISKTVIKEGKRQSYAVVTDLAGMPRELITTEGKAAWIGKTTLWGEIEEEHQNKEYGTDCKLRFAGQWYDEESRLCYNWHRYYDAETARYVSPDPIGLAGGLNAYAYVHNPLTWVDPFGLQKEIFYRSMNEKDYEEFLKTGKIPATGETFISPTEAYSQKYDGVLVKFEVAPGTTDQLKAIGFKNNANELSNLNLPTSAPNWTQNNAYFKWETPKGGEGQMNIGLGKGPALNIFNNNIQGHEVIRR